MKNISLIALLAAAALAPHNAYALSDTTIAAGNAQADQDRKIEAADETVTNETRTQASIIEAAGAVIDAGTMAAVAAGQTPADAPAVLALQSIGMNIDPANIAAADAIINGNGLGAGDVTVDNVAAAAELLAATLPLANLTAANIAAVVSVAAGDVRQALVWAIATGWGDGGRIGDIPGGIATVREIVAGGLVLGQPHAKMTLEYADATVLAATVQEDGLPTFYVNENLFHPTINGAPSYVIDTRVAFTSRAKQGAVQNYSILNDMSTVPVAP